MFNAVLAIRRSEKAMCEMQMSEISRMLFSELYQIMVNKAIIIGFRAGDRPNHPLDPPLRLQSFADKLVSPCFRFQELKLR